MADQTPVQIPSKYLKIIQDTIDFLAATNNTNNWKNRNYKKLDYLLKKEKEITLPYLVPIGIYRSNNCEFYLTKEDVLVFLDYPFVLDRETLIFALNKIGVVTRNKNRIDQTTVYKWNTIKTQEWKDRYRKLMIEEWNWNGSAYTAKETKRKIMEKISLAEYDPIWQEIRERIETNHKND